MSSRNVSRPGARTPANEQPSFNLAELSPTFEGNIERARTKVLLQLENGRIEEAITIFCGSLLQVADLSREPLYPAAVKALAKAIEWGRTKDAERLTTTFPIKKEDLRQAVVSAVEGALRSNSLPQAVKIVRSHKIEPAMLRTSKIVSALEQCAANRVESPHFRKSLSEALAVFGQTEAFLKRRAVRAAAEKHIGTLGLNTEADEMANQFGFDQEDVRGANRTKAALSAVLGCLQRKYLGVMGDPGKFLETVSSREITAEDFKHKGLGAQLDKQVRTNLLGLMRLGKSDLAQDLAEFAGIDPAVFRTKEMKSAAQAGLAGFSPTNHTEQAAALIRLCGLEEE